MKGKTDLVQRLREGMASFSKGQRRIAAFLIDHFDKAAFMTAHRLGESTGVSESTVVRFATELGYDGYPHLQRELQSMVKTRLTSVQRIEMASARMSGKDVLRDVLEADIGKIRVALEETSAAMFERAAGLLLSARRIYILGLRSSSFLAGLMGYYFGQMFDNCTVISTSGEGDIFERLLRLSKEDVLVGISFPRYSTRTMKAMRFARDRGGHIISLTDSDASPIAGIGECTLVAPSDMVSFADSLVAPMSLINALIAAVGIRKKEELSRTFAELEAIWDEYQVYEKFDREP